MLEKYFMRLETLDRIRGSWIAPAIEKVRGVARRESVRRTCRLRACSDADALRRLREATRRQFLARAAEPR